MPGRLFYDLRLWVDAGALYEKYIGIITDPAWGAELIKDMNKGYAPLRMCLFYQDDAQKIDELKDMLKTDAKELKDKLQLKAQTEAVKVIEGEDPMMRMFGVKRTVCDSDIKLMFEFRSVSETGKSELWADTTKGL